MKGPTLIQSLKSSKKPFIFPKKFFPKISFIFIILLSNQVQKPLYSKFENYCTGLKIKKPKRTTFILLRNSTAKTEPLCIFEVIQIPASKIPTLPFLIVLTFKLKLKKIIKLQIIDTQGKLTIS